MLQLEHGVEASRIRFYAGTAVLLETAELAHRANRLLDEHMNQLSAATTQAESEAQRAESEAQRPASAELELEAACVQSSRG